MSQELYVLTLDAIEQGRIDTPGFKGIETVDHEVGYRNAAAMSHGERSLNEFRRPFVIRVCGITPDGRKAYLEVGCPKVLRLQFPETCSAERHVVAALRALELKKHITIGFFSDHYNTDRVRPVPMTYGVGYVPGPDGAPRQWSTVELRIPQAGMYRVVRSFFRYERIDGGPNGPFPVEVHQGSGNLVRQFTNDTGVCSAKWCVFEGVRPFKAKGVSTAAFEAIATTARAHPAPPPPPDIAFQAFDIECVGQSKAEWDADRDCSKIPNPNHPGAEVRRSRRTCSGRGRGR